MATTEKTRKLLWARSGSRCALCRGLLVRDGRGHDPHSVVGDECHIVARVPGGPRGGQIDPALIDEYENLIILCKVDHKRVDDQPNHFTSERLRALKLAHEAWVVSSLDPEPRPSVGGVRSALPRVRIVRAPNESEAKLDHIESGQDLLNMLVRSYESSTHHDDPRNEEEADLIADFLEELHGWAEVGDDMSHGDHVRAGFSLTQKIEQLKDVGFLVYAGRLVRTLEANGQREPWPFACVRVVRMTNPEAWNPEAIAAIPDLIEQQSSEMAKGEQPADSRSGASAPPQ